VHLVLPYLEGGELFERIKSKVKYPESDASMVMKCFLSALEYLAQNKIVHRDLKPENLILAKRGDDNFLKIADFGLACILSEEEKKLYLRCGSPGYVSPELLNDKGYDCQADVFSAGVIMYVMLTGRPLFRGDNINEILERNRNCSL
jgi:calcium/calmodulin-dependent protein kinase I